MIVKWQHEPGRGVASVPSVTDPWRTAAPSGYPTRAVGIDPESPSAVTQIIGRRTPAPAPAGAGWVSNRRAIRNFLEKNSSPGGVGGSGRSATRNSMGALMFL
jgi:hypothetical protein